MRVDVINIAFSAVASDATRLYSNSKACLIPLSLLLRVFENEITLPLNTKMTREANEVFIGMLFSIPAEVRGAITPMATEGRRLEYVIENLIEILKG